MNIKSCSIALSALAVLGLSQAQAGPLADATQEHLWGIELGGYLDFSSTYNLNEPAGDVNALRIFDTDDGDIVDFNALQLYMDRLPDDVGEAGFRADIIIGEDASVIGGDDSGIFSGDDDFNLYQAYLSYIAPVGSGLTIDVGRWVTHHGYEVIESPSNDNFSRSILFGFAIPFTHTGIRLSYDFNDMVGVSGAVTQGWDTVEDNNDSLTYHFQLKLQPTEELFISNSFAYGPEKDDTTPGQGQNSDYTFLYDLVATYQVNDQVKLGLNFDYANQSNDGGVFDEITATTIRPVDDFEWYGFGLYGRYDFREDMYAAVRGEYFDDQDGARTGTATEYWEITLTYGYQITEQLLGRVEYRHDDADDNVFDDDGSLDDTQDTIALEVIYTF